MKNYKKRLIVFLVVCFLAVSPLILSVPVSASPLLDGTPVDFDLFVEDPLVGGLRVTLPVDPGDYYFIYGDVESYVLYLFTCHQPFKVFLFEDGSPVLSVRSNIPFDVLCYAYSVYDDSWSLLDSQFFYSFPFNPSSSGFYASSPIVIQEDFNVHWLSGVSVVPVSYTPSILGVFSGVGVWFVSSIGNLVQIFWSADAGLSPLGILAVCSLAFSVILFLAWLIAGWLKFK